MSGEFSGECGVFFRLPGGMKAETTIFFISAGPDGGSGDGSEDFDSGCTVAARVYPDRYVVEIRIPVKPLNVKEILPGQQWKLHVWRNIRNLQSPASVDRGGIDGLRPYGKAAEKLPADKDAVITLLHDRLNLYVKWTQRLPLKAKKGWLQLPELECNPDRNYPRDQVWKNGVNTRMTLEFFLAPPDRSRYFQFACNNHGALYDAEGYNAKFDCGFRAKVRKTAAAFEAIFTVPLLELGINVNTGNRISGMFCGPFGSWNGGQVHQMSGFQNLYLEMQ